MPPALGAYALGLLLTLHVCSAADASFYELTLGHALQPGEAVVLEVDVGTIGPGQELLFTTADGQPLGAVSPFGIRAGQEAGTYLVALAPAMLIEGRLKLRSQITQRNGPPRAPTAAEMKSLKLRSTRALVR